MEATHGFKQRARETGVEFVLKLHLKAAPQFLILHGELFATDASLWRDTAQPQRGSLSHLHARVRIDAEIKTLLAGTVGPQGPLLFSAPRLLLQTSMPVLAVAAEDVDADGRSEFLSVGPRHLSLLSVQGSRLVATQTVDLTAAPAAIQPRRPIGLVRVVRSASRLVQVVVWTSYFRDAMVYTTTRGILRFDKTLSAFPWSTGTRSQRLIWRTGTDHFVATSGVETPDTSTKSASTGTNPSYVYAAREWVSSGSKYTTALLGIDGTLSVRTDKVVSPLILHSGLAFDLIDQQHSGRIDIAVTDTGAVEDRVLIYGLDKQHQMVRKAISPGLGGSAVQLVHGRLGGAVRDSLVAIVRKGNSWRWLQLN